MSSVALMNFDFAQQPDWLGEGLSSAAKAARMSHGLIIDAPPDGARRLLAHSGFRVVDFDLDDSPGSLVDRLCSEASHRGDIVSLQAVRRANSIDPFRSGVAVPLATVRDATPVLVLGAPIHYEYRPADLLTMRSVADVMSAAIMRTIDHGETLVQHAQAAAAITALEIAQLARHEARGLLGTTRELLAVIRARVNRHDDFGALQGLDELDEALSGVNVAIDKIRNATKPPIREERPVRLQDLFDAACSQVRGRLQSLNVRVRYDGTQVEVVVYEDWLRQVFLNLLLNSLDAFAEARRKPRREIGLLVSPLAPSDAYLAMRFFDTATGVLHHRGDRHDSSGSSVPWDEAIFAPGYSTKEGGSGYGLYLCRTIMADHGGSIRLVDSRGGTTFELLLPSSRAIRLAG